MTGRDFASISGKHPSSRDHCRQLRGDWLGPSEVRSMADLTGNRPDAPFGPTPTSGDVCSCAAIVIKAGVGNVAFEPMTDLDACADRVRVIVDANFGGAIGRDAPTSHRAAPITRAAEFRKN